jgi:hypothetical protein
MFGPYEMILTSALVSVSSAGTYYLCRSKYHQLGYRFGVESTVDSLIREGFLEVEKDKDGDDSIVTIKEVKSRANL